MANEIVNAFLKELQLSAPRDRAEINARLEKSAGKRSAAAIRSAIEDGRIHEENFFDMSCAQLRTALDVAGIADLAYIRTACEYFLQYSVAFEGSVLDVGCGCGILSCFIAKVYPNTRVTAIDRNAAAIRCARQLAQRLDLKNITFIETALADLPKGQYDTVLCARALQENLLPAKADEQDYWYDILAAEVVGQERIHALAVELASHLSPDGCLICMEDMERDPLFYSYLTILNELNVGVIPQTCFQWDNESPLNYTPIQAFVANRGSRLDHENLYWIWATLLSRGVDMNGASFDGYIGDIFVRRVRGALLSGMNFYDENGRLVRKMMLWANGRGQNDGTMYFQQLNMQEHSRTVECYADGTRKIVDGYYDRCKKGWEIRGRRTERFVMNEQYEEIPLKED